MKTNIIEIAKKLQAGSVPEEHLFSSVMNDLLRLKDNCANLNIFTQYPEANDYKKLYELVNEIPAFDKHKSQPTVWGQFIADTVKQVDNLSILDPSIDKGLLLSDLTQFDGFQEYNQQKTVKEEKSLVGVGAFDAMFISMDNEEAQSHNEKEKDFSITKKDNTYYVRFKAGIVKEESMIDLDSGIIFSSTDILDYTRFNCFVLLENEIVQIISSTNKTFGKEQIHLYCLDSDGNIKEKDNATVAQYVNYDDTSSYCKLIRFVENYITDFNSSIFSYDEDCFVFKGVTSILKPKIKSNFFEEYNTKGFEFPLFPEYNKHVGLRENKLKEDIEFQMKKEGKKEYGDRANALGTSLRQSNIFLLEEFTNLEKERLLLNIKPRLNVPEFDSIDFTQKLNLDLILQGNLYKMKAMDALDIYCSNISPELGKALFKFFSITDQDIEVDDFARFKTSVIDFSEQIENIEEAFVDLSQYVYDIRDVITFDDKNVEKNVFGQLFIQNKNKCNEIYPNVYIETDVINLITKRFNLTNLRDESFIFDQRRVYLDEIVKFLEKSGAENISLAKKTEINNCSVDDILMFRDDKIIENHDLHVLYVRFTDKRYYNERNDFESFSNQNIAPIINETLSLNKDLFESIDIAEELNSTYLVFTPENKDKVESLFEIFEQKKIIQQKTGEAL